jgi:adenosine kinase
MRNQALIIGSVVYDDIFDIHGKMRNEISIKDGKLDVINMMFTAKTKKRNFGGIAGNVAYGLAQQKESPFLFSWVGGDFSPDYEEHCKKQNIQIRVFNAGKGKYTATWYGISDEEKQQIGIFQPNAYGDFVEKTPLNKTLTDEDFDKIKIVSISPGRGIGMLAHLKEIKDKTNGKVLTILHPGQELSVSFDSNIVNKSLKLADIVIGNEIEFSQFQSLYNLSPQDIMTMNPKIVIETRGKEGSIIYKKDQKIKIPVVKAKKVVETTGAGDAFLAGLIKGLLHDWPIEKCAENGAKLGALSVEYLGGQGYKVN